MAEQNPDASSDQPQRKRWPLVVSSLIFVAAAWYAITGVDVPPSQVRWWAVAVLVVLGVPATTILNGEEFRTIAQLLGQRFSRASGIEVSILGSAANVLPVPGAVLIRVRAMRAAGASYGQATTAIAIAGVAWAGAAALVAGALLLTADVLLIGAVGVAAGGAAWVGAFLMVRWRLTGPGLAAAWGRLLAVEVASVLVGAVRFVLVLVAVGEPVTLAQGAALTVAGVVATATGVFPGGLGLREALAALIGPLVALPARSALLAAVGNRIADYVFLGPAALLVTRVIGESVVMRQASGDRPERGSSAAGFTAVGEESDDQVREQTGGDDLE